MDGPLEVAFLPDDGAQESQWQRDLQEFEEEARAALIAALSRPLTVDEVSAISWWAGVTVLPPRAVPPMPRDGLPPF